MVEPTTRYNIVSPPKIHDMYYQAITLVPWVMMSYEVIQVIILVKYIRWLHEMIQVTYKYLLTTINQEITQNQILI